MEVTTLYKYGFEYKGVVYGWKNKKLFRLPYTKDKRSYSLKEIQFYCYKSTLVANIQRDKLTLNRIKTLTKEINIEINSYICDDMPF